MANQNINLLISIIMDDPTINYCKSVKEIHIPMITRFDRLILVFKDLSDFKHRIFRQSDTKNDNLARNVKCRFCDFIGSQTVVQNHEVQAHHDQVDDCNQYELSSERHVCDSQTSDTKCQHRSLCMLTSSQRTRRQEQTQADHVVLSGRDSYSCH